jgi:hypothetical protein
MISEVSQIRRRLYTMLGKKKINKPRQSQGDQDREHKITLGQERYGRGCLCHLEM